MLRASWRCVNGTAPRARRCDRGPVVPRFVAWYSILRSHAARYQKGDVMSDFGNAELELVRNLVRRVDKNLEHQAKLGPDGESVVISLKQGRLKGEVRIPLESLREANESLANMEAMRQRIKRGRDAMHASVGQVPLRNNSAVKPQQVEGSYFFRSGGNRQGGGRR